jgi:hypothetical protein
MKPMRIGYSVLLCLLFAAVTYAIPQQEEPKSHEGAAASQERPEAKPEGSNHQENAKPEKSEKENQAKQEKEEKQSDRDKQSDRKEDNARTSEGRAGSGHEMNGQNEHAHPAGKGGHIPDDKFRSSFGREHKFKPSRPVVVNNQQTIQYGGYNFALVDSWPADWAYSDDVYLDYVDGEYFLYDLLHPGMRIAVFVVE